MSIVRRNNVTISGAPSGPPMLLAHGFGCEQSMWRLLTPAFAESHKLVLFDHVGCGASDLTAYNRNRYGVLDGYATDVLEICGELDLRDVIFVGHSVSATIGLLAAIREPERFSRLVLVSPSPSFLDEDDYRGGFSRADIYGLLEMLDANHLGWSKAMAPVIMGHPERPELADELEQSFCRTDPDIARHFARVTFLSNHRADLPRVRVRSQILQVEKDTLAPLSVGEYMHRQLAGSTLSVIPTTGHCPHLSAPRETAAAIRAFLGMA
jgi:sigma-B regulation protein RsbQ